MTLECIPQGKYVLEYAGEVIDASEHIPHSFPIEPLLTQMPKLYLRTREISSFGKFINHSDQPCLSVLRLSTGCDPRQTRLLLFSCRPIEKDEELTVNYEQLRGR